MARIRSIKPEFFTSEDVSALSIPARLLFIGLWTEADREGRLEDRPRQLKGRLFPHDAIDVETLLEELALAGVIVRYVVEAQRLISIPTFSRHQRPHIREAPSTLSPPEHNQGSAEHSLGAHTCGRHPGEIPVEGKGREGSGKGREGATSPPSASTVTPLRPLVGKRNLRAAYEHPRFDVPDWWHLEKVKGLPDGESGMARFYAWLSGRVERTNEVTEPRKPWLNEAFAAWLAEAVARPSGVPGPEETRRMLAEKAARAGR